MHPSRTPRLLGALLAASVSVAAAACGSDGEDDAGRTDTTSNRGTAAGGDGGVPVQGDPDGANSGAGGDGGATGGAVDPGGDSP